VNKNDITQGAGWLGKLTALACHPTKKVSKAEELSYLSTNIDLTKRISHKCLEPNYLLYETCQLS